MGFYRRVRLHVLSIFFARVRCGLALKRKWPILQRVLPVARSFVFFLLLTHQFTFSICFLAGNAGAQGDSSPQAGWTMWLQTDGVKPPTPPPTPPANQNAGVGRANVELAIGTLAVVIGGILCCGLVAVRFFNSVYDMTDYFSVLMHFFLSLYISTGFCRLLDATRVAEERTARFFIWSGTRWHKTAISAALMALESVGRRREHRTEGKGRSGRCFTCGP